MSDVTLVSMPWAPVHEPSLGLAILKSCLIQEGISTEVFHGAPELLRWVSVETYQFIADGWGINEFMFTGVLDPELDPTQEASLHRYLTKAATRRSHSRYRTVSDYAEVIDKLRKAIIPAFIDDCVAQILDRKPSVVGFTCLFDQIIASVAVATRIRQAAPGIRIMLGGYALQRPVADTVARAFPWIDAIALGDGERIVAPLVRELMDPSYNCTDHPVVRDGTKADMASVPLPDYDDWFAQLRSLANGDKVDIRTKVLPVESSRGCWWGERNHCVFCGIDDDSLAYRYKSPEATLQMLRSLRDRYGEHTFRFSDYIMPKAYYSDLLPLLASESPRFRLHSEVKSYHPPERVEQFAAAGFHEIQPGIESFSTAVLDRMDKGARGIFNVSLLKAAYRNAIIVDYNLLYGLPKDGADDYVGMLERIPSIYHLNPPVSRTEVVVTRFAPLQADPARFGLPKPRHHKCYDVMFSAQFLEDSGFDLDEYAYYFDRNFEYSHELQTLYSQMVLQVEHWKGMHRDRFVRLSYHEADGHLMFTDSRFQAEGTTFSLSIAASKVYSALDWVPVPAEKVAGGLSDCGEDGFESALAELERRRLIWREGHLLFGLGVEREIADAHERSGWTQLWPALWPALNV